MLANGVDARWYFPGNQMRGADGYEVFEKKRKRKCFPEVKGDKAM